jgi:phosphatidylinositol alpha-1,6-mannosyltransferase
MNILILCTDAFGGYGGIALFNRELTRALALMPERGEIVMLPRLIPNAPEAVPEGVRFVVPAARGSAAYARELVRVTRKRKFDLVICGHINLLPLARFATKDPLLITHGIEAWRPMRRSARLVTSCRAVVSVSDLTRSRLLSWSHFSGPAHVLPNAIRAEQYGVRERRPDLVARYNLAGKRVLLTVGRLNWSERYKGFDEVVDLLTDLPQDVVYLIAGGGSDVPRLQQKALRCGVADRVKFTGIFDEQEKADLYALADVFVMPSRGEGFGFVFLEAMASGVPVIGSKHDGGREALLGGRLGALIDPSNPAEIRAAVEDALATPTRKVPEDLDYFAFERFAERVHEIVRRSCA